MSDLGRASAFSRVIHLAAQRAVHEAFQWMHLQEPRIMDWQAELVAIAAPPFHEEQRAAWLADRFRELGLDQVEIDSTGNVLGSCPPSVAPEAGWILLSAHIDTIFPPGLPIRPKREGSRLQAPGACDNGAGLAGLLAIAAALKAIAESAIVLPLQRGILFAGNVGEEGDGDLRGMRHLYLQPPWRGRIAANLVLDGAGHEIVVSQALGSRRFMVTITAPGGHSWTDAGTPNPIVLLSTVISRLSELKLGESPRTTMNVGTIEGGTSVNAIPESASARFDFRSTDAEQLIRLEVELHRAVEDVVLAANRQVLRGNGPGGAKGSAKVVGFAIRKIGDRPAAALPEDAKILEALRAVDRHLGIRTELRTASTDANIPLSLGIEAVSIGAGGDGGGVHTYAEWYDSRDRETGLRRILLLLLALAGSAD
ncbi:Peptidase T [Acidisarcina polymorpha]|uniref:Peptidase T n=1 Tax=Acidisarcina polymorpha TaxID=2211140 RepID=A0A2Z5G5Q9_9BACT|nr:M20/M25/M40 family metallo-hydrolase [Acidisarcina polymorpha]AXC14431.1 Peptidase T [Acidisarcina polymorpha]